MAYEKTKGISMENSKQLIKEHNEWVSRYMEAHERFAALLPRTQDASKQEELALDAFTEELLVELHRVEKEIDMALGKMEEIWAKIASLYS